MLLSFSDDTFRSNVPDPVAEKVRVAKGVPTAPVKATDAFIVAVPKAPKILLDIDWLEFPAKLIESKSILLAPYEKLKYRLEVVESEVELYILTNILSVETSWVNEIVMLYFVGFDVIEIIDNLFSNI